ncbi:MAG: DUF6998 domain-containing protein [Verrucomicrobiales bacterium]
MALTQIQIIQSLGEAMNWLERELSWEVAIQEQRHLIGRIGELYAALMTGGQMAPEINQAGYDVVSSSGERISVKTTTQQGTSGHIAFSATTLNQVDRVMIFFLNTDEMQIETLIDAPLAEINLLLSDTGGKRILPLRKLRSSPHIPTRQLAEQKVVHEAAYEAYHIKEYESGTIVVLKHGKTEPVAKPILREISKKLGLSILNSNGNPMNTRQLGARIIKEISS